MTSDALVSVVIPSYRRHKEVIRAVRSALDQSLSPLEVIVSNDGADSEKAVLLAEMQDARVKFLEAPRRGNASATRNYGIRHASGAWVALLDDDDVWRPSKLEDQFLALKESCLESAVLLGVEEVHSGSGDTRLRPSREVPLGVSASELLFSGIDGVHTSTILAPASCFERYLFNEALERHEDWEWLLQVGQDWPMVICPDIVCERWLKPGEGLSRPGGFEFTRAWYQRNKELIAFRSRAEFVAGVLSRKAAYDRNLRALPWLGRELVTSGGAKWSHVVRMLLPWVANSQKRARLRTFIAGCR